jgi:translocation and assembly module TamA
MTARFLALALWALVLGGMCGCALLTPAPPEATATEPAGPPTVVVDIDAPGELKALLERHLDLSLLGTLARGQALSDTELTRLIDATPTQVRELLQTEGYFEPEVTIAREPPLAINAPERVRLKVVPGPQTVVRRVDLEVEGPLSLAIDAKDPLALRTVDNLRTRWPLKAGTPFSNPVWSDAKNTTLGRLRASGYASATWSGTAADIDAPEKRARLFLVADSGPLFRSGDIEIDGLVLHDRETVLNLANIRRGTPVTETLLLDFQDRLVKSGLFEGVSVTLDANPQQADAARVIVRVVELPLHQLTIGLGYSANSGERVTLEHIYRRVFGYAATARNKFEIAQTRQAWDGELSTHPGKNFYRNLIGGAIERLETDDDTVLSQRVRIGRTRESQRIDRLYFAEVERSSRTTDLAETSSTAYSLNYNYVWRNIDNPLLPTRGLTMSLQGGIGVAHDSTSKTGGFGRAYGRLTGYLPLGGSWFGQARVEAGQVFSPKNLEIPDSLRFRAGGDDSIRGYAFRSLGPLDAGAVTGGDVLLTTSVEVARPILASMPTLWGAVFVDAGNASNSFNGFDPVVGSGVGVRWRSPVGPLRVDYAYAHELKSTRLHIGVGIVF